MYYNPEIPLEQALDMFEDSHIRYEIIEDYHAAYLIRKMGEVATEMLMEQHDEAL